MFHRRRWRNFAFLPTGYGIKLDEHDIDISVHGLISALATPADAAASLGKLGGAARSEAKRVTHGPTVRKVAGRGKSGPPENV